MPTNLINKLGHITCRQILSLMVLFGFMLNFMLRVNMAFAIVAMIKNSDSNITTNSTDITSTVEPKFQWNTYQKNQILGSFYGGYFLTQVPGGRLAEVIGSRKVFGGGVLITGILTIMTPVVCQYGFILTVILRALTGVFLGVTFAAAPPIAARWIPPLERSKFISNYSGVSLGTAFTMPLCGFLISKLGWQSVFYVTGGIAVVWSVAWFFLVYDSPSQHPRISPEERAEIESKLLNPNQTTAVRPDKVPWLAIATSIPVWALVLTFVCNAFNVHLVMNQLPTYMNEVLYYNTETNGVLSSLPHLASYSMALISGYFADHLLSSGKLSIISVRKIFNTIALLIPGLLMMVQALFGYIPSLSVTLFTLALFFRGAISSGVLANTLDIAPSFSGTIMGIANTLGTLGGWSTTFLVAAITGKDNSFSQWQYIFWIMSSVHIMGALIFLIFASGTTQPWNLRTPVVNGTYEMIESGEVQKKKLS